MKTIITNLFAIGCLSNLLGETIVPVPEETKRISMYIATGDQAALAEFAQNKDNETEFRQMALEHLTDKIVLAKIAQNDENEWIRMRAAGMLNDQLLLADFAENGKDMSVRLNAIVSITNTVILMKLALNDNNANIRYHAMRTLNDQTLLVEFVKDVNNPLIFRRNAVGSLTDKAVLLELVEINEDGGIRNAAIRRLGELNKKNETDEERIDVIKLQEEIKKEEAMISNLTNDNANIVINTTEDESLKNETTTTSSKWLFVSIIGLLFLSFSAVFLLIRKQRIIKGEKTK